MACRLVGAKPLSEPTRYVDGTPTSEVTPVTIRYIHPPHLHGCPLGHCHDHEWSTHIPFIPCQSALYSSNKAISNFDLETASSMSWVWSKGKTIQSAHYLIDLLSFCFTSDNNSWETAFWHLTLKNQRSRSGVRSNNSPSTQPMHLLFISHQSDQPFLRYVQKSVWPWKNTSEICQNKSFHQNPYKI